MRLYVCVIRRRWMCLTNLVYNYWNTTSLGAKDKMATITGRTIFCVLLCLVGLSNGSVLPSSNEAENAADVSIENKCPSECTCQKIEAVCIHKDLKEIPTGFYDEVKFLMLTSNEIEKIEEDTFEKRKLYEIVSLLLNHNKISEIHPNAFHILKRLQVVDLGSNSVTNLDSNLFVNNTELLTVRLDNNLNLILPENGPFLISSTLTELNISNCNIYTLPTDTFSQSPKLDTIDLRGNNITDLNTAAFVNLTSLVKLSLPLSLKNQASKICTDLEFLNDLTFGRGNLETRLECDQYRHSTSAEISTTDDIYFDNSTSSDELYKYDSVTNEFLEINDTFNATSEISLNANSSEENDEINENGLNITSIDDLSTPIDTSIALLAIADNSTEEEDLNISSTRMTLDLLESIQENFDKKEQNFNETDAIVLLNNSSDEMNAKTKSDYAKDDTMPLAPMILPSPNDIEQNLKTTKNVDNETPNTAKSSGLSGPTVDNIILGFIITAVVVGVVFIIIKRKTKSRNNKKQQNAVDEQEGVPLKNMASA